MRKILTQGDACHFEVADMAEAPGRYREAIGQGGIAVRTIDVTHADCQDWPAVGRSVALNLAAFCDQSLPYTDMVAEASRRAAARIAELEAKLAKANRALDDLTRPF